MENQKYWLTIIILVIVIVILSYFITFSLGKYVTGSAIMNPPFYINAWDIKAREVVIGLKNNGQEDYKIQSVSVEGCGSYNTPTDIKSGTKVTFIISCEPALKKGDKFKGDVVITYKKVGGIDLISKGSISGKVLE